MNVISVILIGCFALSPLRSYSAVIGQVYDVVEPDALTEIEQKAGSVDWKKALDKPQDEWGAFTGVDVPYANETKRRTYIPFYTAEFDVKDSTGRILYPKGFTFNPLAFATLPNRIVVIDPAQETWLEGKIRATDQIIFTHGNVVKARERLHVPIFILDEKTRQRLDIQAVPSIVEQKGQMLSIQEYEFKGQ